MYFKLCNITHILTHVSHLKVEIMKNQIHTAIAQRPLGFFSIW